MKKLLRLALISCLFLTIGNLYAQEQPLRLGVKAGINFSNATIDNKKADPNIKVGYQVGVSVYYSFCKSFLLESGLYFTTKGSKIKNYYAGRVACGTGMDGDTHTFNELYLQLPVYAGYKLHFTEKAAITFFVGPYVACGVGGRTKYVLKNSIFSDGKKEIAWDTFGKKEYDTNERLKRVDTGIGFGINGEVNSIILGIGCEFGALNLLRNDFSDATYRNKSFSITLGYKF